MNTVTDTRAATKPTSQSPLPRLAIWLIAAGAFGLELAVSGRYGYVRDELYFLAAGRHLAFGYVDQPALTPLIARISAALTGNSLVGLRLVPALGLAALVVVTAAMSRLLGAGRTGQVLAALCATSCGEYVAAMHELTTTMPDFVLWAVVLLLVTKLLATQDPRWWIAAGIASAAKWNIAFLAASLAVGFLANDARRLLRSRYLIFGCGIAAVFAVPDLAWQAAHGWPNLAVFRALQLQAWHNRAVYWPHARSGRSPSAVRWRSLLSSFLAASPTIQAAPTRSWSQPDACRLSAGSRPAGQWPVGSGQPRWPRPAWWPQARCCSP